MKITEYAKSNQWVGTMECPDCHVSVDAWRSSGMSMCFPHFYCNQCSNVIRRAKDQELVSNGVSKELLDRIAADLPACGCGGYFKPGSNPKCPACGTEFPHLHEPVNRLQDPNMIVLDRALVYGDHGVEYMVRIVDKSDSPSDN